MMDVPETVVLSENDVVPQTIAKVTQARRTRVLASISDCFEWLDEHDLRGLPLAAIAAPVGARRAEIDIPSGQC
jgi:hypothetical protein